MGIRFYRRLHILPGLRLNVGTRSASVSFGHRGCWYTIGPHGRRTATLGWPGSGLRWTETTGGRKTPLPPQKPAPSAVWSLVTLGLLALIFRIAWSIGSAMAS